MGLLIDTRALLLRYPLTFLALGAACALAAPVILVSMSSALRPWAKRILADALAVRREAERIADESREAYADLLAEVVSDEVAATAPQEARAVACALQAVRRAEPRAAQQSASPAA